MNTYFSQRSWWIALTLTVMMSIVLASCGGSTTTTAPAPTTAPTTAPTPSPTATTAPAATVTVKIVEKNEKYSFQPATLNIKAGTEVIWDNVSDAMHTVTSDTGAFNTTSPIAKGQKFMFTFTTAGMFAYHCDIHPYMKATIVVS
jgi:plastocyanin